MHTKKSKCGGLCLLCSMGHPMLCSLGAWVLGACCLFYVCANGESVGDPLIHGCRRLAMTPWASACFLHPSRHRPHQWRLRLRLRLRLLPPSGGGVRDLGRSGAARGRSRPPSIPFPPATAPPRFSSLPLPAPAPWAAAPGCSRRPLLLRVRDCSNVIGGGGACPSSRRRRRRRRIATCRRRPRHPTQRHPLATVASSGQRTRPRSGSCASSRLRRRRWYY